MSRARRFDYGPLAFAAALAACQVARSTPGDVRLPERSKSPPPTFQASGYVVDAAELLPSDLRGRRELTSSATNQLPAVTFVAGRSYRLRVTAKASSSQGALVSVKFREPKHNGSFRSFGQRITGDKAREYSLDFSAPAFATLAELSIDVGGGSLSIETSSLGMVASLPRTEAVASWAGSYVPEGYALVFNDEFSGSSLDRRKWFTRYIYDSERLDRLNDENQRYADNDNHRVAGGVLQLVAKRLKLSKPSGINYESGLIRSDWTGRYGFYEARVKMPSGLGAWAAFWVNSDVSETGRLGHPPEIDFFEFVNNGKDDKVNKIHSAATRTPTGTARFLYQNERFIEKHQDYRAPFNFDQGFHTIGTEWTPEAITLYVDGLKIYSRTFEWKYQDGELAGPAHVLLNLAIGGQWAGRYGIDDAAFPQALVIDWVRVYQKQP